MQADQQNLILSTAKAQNHNTFLQTLMDFQETVINSHASSPLQVLRNSQFQDHQYQQTGQILQSAMEELQQSHRINLNLAEKLEETQSQLHSAEIMNQTLLIQNSTVRNEFKTQKQYCEEVCNLNGLFEERIQALQNQKQNSEELAQQHLDDLELFRQQQSHYQEIMSQQLHDLNAKLQQKQDQITHLTVECAAHKSNNCDKCPLYELDLQTLQTRCQKCEETLQSERKRFSVEREKLIKDHNALSQFAKQMLEDDLKSQSTVGMDKDYLTKLVAKLQIDKEKLQARVEVLSRDKTILQNLQPHDSEFTSTSQQNVNQDLLQRVLLYEQKLTEFATEAAKQSQQLESLLSLVESKREQTQDLENEVNILLQRKPCTGLQNVSAVKRISQLQRKISELEQQGSNLDKKSIKNKIDELILLVGVDNCSGIVLNLQLLQEIEVDDEKSEQLLLEGCSIVEQKIHTLRDQLQVGLKQLLREIYM